MTLPVSSWIRRRRLLTTAALIVAVLLIAGARIVRSVRPVGVATSMLLTTGA